jgi:hypothetical protein
MQLLFATTTAAVRQVSNVITSHLSSWRRRLRRFILASQILLLASLAYCSTRLALAVRDALHDGGVGHGGEAAAISDPADTVLGLALLASSVAFSLLEIVACYRLNSRVAAAARGALTAAAFSEEGADGAEGGGGADGKGKGKGKASLVRLMRLARPEYPMLALGFVMLVFSSASSVVGPLYVHLRSLQLDAFANEQYFFVRAAAMISLCDFAIRMTIRIGPHIIDTPSHSRRNFTTLKHRATTFDSQVTSQVTNLSKSLQ